MTASIHKEIRSLAPVLIITVVLTSAASLVFNGRDSTSLVNLVFGFCCLIMGAISLGNEYQARTMMLLLAQPKPRQRIWGQKMLVLGLALALAYGATLLSVQFLMSGEGAGQDNFLGRIFILLPVPVLVFCTAPFVTLVVKNTLGAVVFTVIVSALICLVFFGNVWLLHKCFPQLIEQMKDDRRIFALGALYFGPSAICCAAIYWLGYRKFMNLEMIDGQGQEVALPVKLEVVLGAALKRFLPGYTGPTASLIRKELQLQRASFIVAGVVGALLLAEAVWRAASQSQMNEGWLQATFILYVFVIPFLTGSVCMAEERNWGVAAWQFTLPPAAMQQGVIKLMVTGLTFLMLGIVFPLLILLVGQKWLGLYPKIFDAGRLWDWIAGVHMYLAVFSLVVLASSFSRNTLRAILISFGLILVLTGLEEAFFHLWQNIGHPNEFGQQSEVEAWLAQGLCPSVWLLILLAGAIAFHNFRNGDLAMWRRLQSWSVADFLVEIMIPATILVAAHNWYEMQMHAGAREASWHFAGMRGWHLTGLAGAYLVACSVIAYGSSLFRNALSGRLTALGLLAGIWVVGKLTSYLLWPTGLAMKFWNWIMTFTSPQKLGGVFQASRPWLFLASACLLSSVLCWMAFHNLQTPELNPGQRRRQLFKIGALIAVLLLVAHMFWL